VRTKKIVGEQALITHLNHIQQYTKIPQKLDLNSQRAAGRLLRAGTQTLQASSTRLESILDPDAEEVEVLKVLRNTLKEAHSLTRGNDLIMALQKIQATQA
jgi:hypothetical protein